MNEELQKYFENIYKDVDPKIILDEDQINAIMNDDDYTLVLAGAGTGKTTTMAGKVKYLVDIKHVNPKKILVISYTKKAVGELQLILNDKFNIPCDVVTFHSLAYKYIRKLFNNRKCYIVDNNMKEEIFTEYINKLLKEKRIKALLNTFNSKTLKNKYFKIGNFFKENIEKYDDYDTFFKDYKKKKLAEAKQIGIRNVIDKWIEDNINNDNNIRTINNEYVKSAGEAVIANFLYTHGIDYEYEKIYEKIVEDRKIYKPDFTLDLAGSPVYIEYFGLDDEDYIRNKKKKIAMHKEYNNKLISIDRNVLDNIEKELDKKLKEFGFVYNIKTDEEILDRILDNNKLSQVYILKNLFYSSILTIKENVKRSEYYDIATKYINSLNNIEKELARNQFHFINDFYIFYSEKLYEAIDYGFDYSDLIYYSNMYIKNYEFLHQDEYDYIVIDEYQDISDGEYLLAKQTSDKCHAKVFAVGDDWQSIYAFRGSNIEYITRFNDYFKKATILKLSKTYRNSQELVDISSSFIMVNEAQLMKQLISSKNLDNPIVFVDFNSKNDGYYYEDNNDIIPISDEMEKVKDVIKKIHDNNPESKILILARRNENIEFIYNNSVDFVNEIGTKIKYLSIDDAYIDGMTIHKSKGLTYDEVILIGMDNNFPTDISTYFWIIWLFSPIKKNEPIEFAEERRVMYVALTRTKNHVYILSDTNANKRSSFIDELKKIIKNK